MAETPTGRLTHVDEAGAARMVDVSGKQVTTRTATASGRVLVSAEVVALLRGAGVPKGDTLAVAGLTVVDMVKAVDKGAVITEVRVETKTGGKSGDWVRGSAS